RDPLLDRDVGEQGAAALLLTSHQTWGSWPILAEVAGFFSKLLVELLIASAIGALVIAGIGSAVLTSEVRLSGANVISQTLKDDLAQASNLIRYEVEMSSLVEDSGTYPTACGTGASVKLVITGKYGAWQVIYATRSVPSTSTDWTGPFALVRCGPVYDSSGNINAGGASSESVVLDRLPTATSMTATLNKTSSTLARSLEVTLAAQAGSSSPVTRTFQSTTDSNPIFSLYDLYLNNPSSCAGGSSPCSTAGGVNHYRPLTSTTTITASSTESDIAYFPGQISSYSFRKTSTVGSGPCTRTSCYVSGGGYGIQLNNFNVLVFSDGELRI
ncbi:hypothetical protein, partial [Synechococcus sp. CCY9202]|uniref:hypothetical protein n=1 Tax=Synechococcus sp. CCY9202 TaxID=174698 RepID=UPI002B20A870